LYNGTLNKIPPYEELKAKYNLTNDQIAYIGDDLIDIPVMELAGVPIATDNAVPAAKKVAVYVTQSGGGYGAFREAVEWLLNEQGRLTEVIDLLRKKVQNQK
jgi:3-deoxy-D-manno-octulosonate 8-phosphate phosphatase (KDO 8-P phosphatase)